MSDRQLTVNSHEFMPNRRKKQPPQRKAALPSAGIGQLAGAEQLFTENGRILCEKCTDIFNFVTSKPQLEIGKGFGQRICHLDLGDECPMCIFLASMKFPGGAESKYDLYGFSAWSLFHGHIGRKKGDKYTALDAMFLAVIPSIKKRMPKDWVLNESRHTGFITTVSKGNVFSAREIPRTIDYKLIKSWLGYCQMQEHHGCQWDTWSEIRNLAVIDCSSRKVIMAPYRCRYIALSYVWGTRKPAEEQNFDLGEEKKLPVRCAKVIEDAIIVTQELGMQYLWVDKYCINQKDPTMKHGQISIMDLVYEGSTVTILANTGESAYDGLPGVRSLSRRAQPSIRVGGRLIVSTLPSPVEAVLGSKWNTRGWTFQESYFSRRRLVFTEDQVYFECDKMHFCESIHQPEFGELDKGSPRSSKPYLDRPRPPLHRFSIPSNQRYEILYSVDGLRDLRKFSYDSKPPYLRIFEYNISRYSSRNLTYDYDSINAFRGVLRTTKNFLHTWGIPYAYPDNGGQYEFNANCYNSLLDLGYGLSWTHGTERRTSIPRRRRDFPSWSWIGWEGTVHWLIPTNAYLNNPKFTYQGTDLVANYQTGDGSKIPLTKWEPGPNNVDPPPQLSLTGNTINVRFEYTTLSEQDTNNRVKEAGFYIQVDGETSYQPTRLHLTQNSTQCPGLDERLQAESWTAIILGRSLDFNVHYLLVVGVANPGDSVFERIGIFQALDGWVLVQQTEKKTILLG